MSTELDRRTVLRAGAGAAAATAAAGTATAQEDGDGESGGDGGSEIDEYLSDTGNYDGTIEDLTGQDEVRIEVGAGENGVLFAPPAIRISAGTTVVWEWTGEGGQHNVVHEGEAFQSELVEEEGHTFQHTFEDPATYLYYCEPHRGIGMRGAVVVQPPEPGPILEEYLADTGNYDGTIEDHRGEDGVTVEVGAGENGVLFAPPAVRVDPGTTVTWEWTGQGGQHNVVHEEGAFESELVEEEGHTFDHTFEEMGNYRYYCDPHRGIGMRGAVIVGDQGATGGSGGAGLGPYTLGAITLVFLIPLLFAVVLMFREMFGTDQPAPR